MKSLTDNCLVSLIFFHFSANVFLSVLSFFRISAKNWKQNQVLITWMQGICPNKSAAESSLL